MEEGRWKREAKALHFRACVFGEEGRWKREDGSNYGGTVTGEE
jgi:hypothetical protein